MKRPTCGPVASLLGRTYLKLAGWKLEGQLPDVPRAILIAAPHTSNWDMPHMIGVAWGLGFHVSWMGKKALFRFPFGWFMKALGGIPIDRSRSHNMVERTAQAMRESEAVYLVVPVEGTRGYADYWKSGFYHIARAAGVPIVCSFLDYRRKVGGVGLVLEPCGDIRADMDRIRDFYRGIRGKHPSSTSRVRVREEDEPKAATG